ncbi:MAG: creatininase family protein [Myxococcales bacterium]|nr:creatininase family protein [Myxococcales bacterium]
MTDLPLHLAELSSHRLRALYAAPGRTAVLWPLGSTEPHGPHLPLATDTLLAEHNALAAARRLREAGVTALVAPPLPYGVTDYADGFTGAISIPAPALVAIIEAAAARHLHDGADHVCLINHHLEPAHLDAITAAAARLAAAHGPHRISAPRVISRRWGARLGDEFRSGACHAGRYEGSLVLAAAPALVDRDAAAALPPLDISLAAHKTADRPGFRALGMTDAYTGDPAAATASEGEALYAILTEMVATTVLEALETP